jgi:uncharacterized membrane protein
VARLRTAFVVLSVTWMAFLPAAAFAASQPLGHASAWRAAFAYLVYMAGSFICHQRPERSFALFGVPLPVCARCTGIYVGAAMMGLAMTVRESRGRLRVGGEPRVLLAAAAVPTVATLVYEWTSGVMPSHSIRAATGSLLGAAVAFIICTQTRDPNSHRQAAPTAVPSR